MKTSQIDQMYRNVRRIKGWLWPHACRLFAVLDDCQKRQGVTGNLFEIGVYEGKSAIILALLLTDQESLGVCDLFNDADERGESQRLQRFRQNVRRCLGQRVSLRIYAKNSRKLSRQEVSENCRLIHIDGGHDSHNIYEDLMLADSCLHNCGAIVLDDAYQQAWPGVIDGIYRFLYEHPGRLVPLVSGFNKLVLVRPDAVAGYAPHVTNASVLTQRFAKNGPYSHKAAEIMGQTVHVYEQWSFRSGFYPRIVTSAAKRINWLRGPLTRWFNHGAHRKSA